MNSEQPSRTNQFEQSESAESKRVAEVLCEEAELMPEVSNTSDTGSAREKKQRFGSAMMLGTVFAGMLAAGSAEAGEYSRSAEYRRAGAGHSHSGETGRRIVSGVLNAVEERQSYKVQEAQQIYAELQHKLQKVEGDLEFTLEKAQRHAERARSEQEAQVILQEGKREAEPLLRAREALLELERKAREDLRKQQIKLEVLRQGRYIGGR